MTLTRDPSHAAIPGNEFVDRISTEATLIPVPSDRIAPSLSEIQLHHAKYTELLI